VNIDIGQDQTAGAAQRRADLITGLHDLAAFLATHPDTPLPSVFANYRIPLGPRGTRVAYLDDVARLLGTEVCDPDDTGDLIAQRWFGPIRAEGHLSPEDRSMKAHHAAVARRAAISMTGSGATA
jgi:hypothetical protein